MSGERDRKIATIAGAQRGRVSRRQLLAAGIGPGVITRLLHRGLVFRLHSGVYAVGHLAPVALGGETAALLAVRGSVLSHHSAAILWGLTRPSGNDLMHVLVTSSSSRGPRGVHVHRTRWLDSSDIRIHMGLPVTSPARTLLDIAEDLTERTLELAYDQAIVTRLVRPVEIERMLDRAPHKAGRPRLAALLARQSGPTLTRSEAEERFLALIRGAELPEPEVNVRVDGYEVDFLWRSEKLVVEIDGFRFHSTRRSFDRDRRKDATLQAAGLRTMRITWPQLVDQAFAVIARLAQALIRGRSWA